MNDPSPGRCLRSTPTLRHAAGAPAAAAQRHSTQWQRAAAAHGAALGSLLAGENSRWWVGVYLVCICFDCLFLVIFVVFLCFFVVGEVLVASCLPYNHQDDPAYRRWFLLVFSSQELTSSDPAILSLDRGRSPRPPAAREARSEEGRESVAKVLSQAGRDLGKLRIYIDRVLTWVGRVCRKGMRIFFLKIRWVCSLQSHFLRTSFLIFLVESQYFCGGHALAGCDVSAS